MGVEDGFFLDLYVNSDLTSFQKAERNVDSLREKVASLTGSNLTMDVNFDAGALAKGLAAFKKLLTAAIDEAWRAGITVPDWIKTQSITSGLTTSTVWGLSNFAKDAMKTSPDALISGMVQRITELTNIEKQGKLNDPEWIAKSQVFHDKGALAKLQNMNQEDAFSYIINKLVPSVMAIKDPTARGKELQNIQTAVGPELTALITELVKIAQSQPSIFTGGYAATVKTWGTTPEQQKALEDNTAAVQEAHTQSSSLNSQWDSFKTTIMQKSIPALQGGTEFLQNVVDYLKEGLFGGENLSLSILNTTPGGSPLLTARESKDIKALRSAETETGLTTYANVGLTEKGRFAARETLTLLESLWKAQDKMRSADTDTTIEEREWSMVMGAIYGSDKGEAEQLLRSLISEMFSRIKEGNPTFSNEQVISEFTKYLNQGVIQLPEFMKKYGTPEDIKFLDLDTKDFQKAMDAQKTGMLMPSFTAITNSALAYASHEESRDRNSSVDINVKIGGEKLPTMSVTPGSTAPIGATFNMNNIMQG